MEKRFTLPYMKRNQLEKAGVGNVKRVGNDLKEFEVKRFLKSEHVCKEKLYLSLNVLDILIRKYL